MVLSFKSPSEQRRAPSPLRWILLGGLAIAGLSSCSIYRLPMPAEPRPSKPVSAELQRRYLSLERGAFEPELTLISDRDDYRHFLGRFTMRLLEDTGIDPANKTGPQDLAAVARAASNQAPMGPPQGDEPQVTAKEGEPEEAAPPGSFEVVFDYYQNKEPGRRPVIVCTPILGGKGGLEKGIARDFTSDGFHGVLVHRGGKTFRSHWTADTIETSFRRAIAARRRVIDWLITRPEVDRARVGAFGISMGAIVTSVLTPVEPRIHSAVMVMPGGDIGNILKKTEEKPLIRYREKRLESLNLSPQAFEDKVRAALDSDPLKLAPYADPHRMLCFISRYDTIVPTDNQLRLREAMGSPEAFVVPTGHYSAIALFPYMQRKTKDFFLERFKKPNPRITPAEK